MAERRSILLAAVSFAAIVLIPAALMRVAEAADISATPQSAEPDLATKKLPILITTAGTPQAASATPSSVNNLIVMPVPPQPSPTIVDAAGDRQSDQQAGDRRVDRAAGRRRRQASVARIAAGDAAGKRACGGRTRGGPAKISSITGASLMARAAVLRRAPSRSTRCCADTKARSTASTILMTWFYAGRAARSSCARRSSLKPRWRWRSATAARSPARPPASIRSPKIAQLSTAPPNWRTYLVRAWEQPSRPADAVLPRTEQEVQYWNRYVAEGWGEGERQANEIFLNDLSRLQRDITGMARYRVLLRAGVVARPRVATKQQAVDGGGNELRAGDRIVTITEQPGLQAKAGVWNGARRCPK
jgi:defect in organelle trafficking protein DotC